MSEQKVVRENLMRKIKLEKVTPAGIKTTLKNYLA